MTAALRGIAEDVQMDPPRVGEQIVDDPPSDTIYPGMAGRVSDYRPAETIYSQGDPSDTIFYIQRGTVKLTVVSLTGREAVVGMLGGGEFFGEGALAGQPARLSTATAMIASRIQVIPNEEMIRLLHQQHALSDRFIAHLLAPNNRLEDDLVDQLFNACEKRLARTLLLLARDGRTNGPSPGLPAISQEVLAEMVGTTRSRVNHFMNKFRKLGFIDYSKDGLSVHPTLLDVLLHDSTESARGYTAWSFSLRGLHHLQVVQRMGQRSPLSRLT